MTIFMGGGVWSDANYTISPPISHRSLLRNAKSRVVFILANITPISSDTHQLHATPLNTIISIIIAITRYTTLHYNQYNNSNFAKGETRSVEYGKVYFVEMQYMGARD